MSSIAPSELERMTRADHCPNCVANTELPYFTRDDRDGGFFAHYGCHDCGHAWFTGWAA